MLNISYLIPLVCFWHTISTEISKYKHELLSNNIISFVNCILFILHHNYEYNLDYAVHIGIGFYIYDLMYIFSRIYRANAKDELKRHFPFIVHHLAGICVLNASLTGESQEHLLGGYNIIERSNIMIYVSYYLHKEYANWFHLNIISDFCQLMTYSYYRLFILTAFIYNNQPQFFQFYFTTQFLIFALYSMGVIWSYKLLNKNIKNFNALKERYYGYKD